MISLLTLLRGTLNTIDNETVVEVMGSSSRFKGRVEFRSGYRCVVTDYCCFTSSDYECIYSMEYTEELVTLSKERRMKNKKSTVKNFLKNRHGC